MRIEQKIGRTFFTPEITDGGGIRIHLSADEVATAIDAYLVARGVTVSGARTIRVNSQLIESGAVFVDPDGKVFVNEIRGIRGY